LGAHNAALNAWADLAINVGGGNVGIGTSTPAYELDVNGAINGTSVLVNGVPVASSTDTYWSANGGGKISYSGGNVGIGTTTPNNKLQIGSTTYSVNSLAMGNGTQNFAIDISERTIPTFFSDNNFSFMASGGGNGNVGIGTAAPLSKISAVNNNFDATTNPGYKFYGHQSSSTATVPLFHIQTAWENTVTANVFKVNTYQNEAGFNILSNGKVGIGTTAPSSLLTVNGGAIEMQFAGVSKGYVWYDLANDYLAIGRGAVSNSIFITNGNVGIGTTTPSSNLTVNGATDCAIQIQSAGVTKGYLWWDSGSSKVGVGPGASNNSFMFNPSTSSVNFLNASCNGTTWIDASDSRLKRDIQPMSKYGLSTVMQLKPVTYFYKADKTNHPEVGFIAQEVQKIVPEVVSGTEGDITKGETLGLSYGNLVPVLTKAIQEQQATIEAQQKQIDELKRMVEVLMKK
jgi:hypothetical protein